MKEEEKYFLEDESKKHVSKITKQFSLRKKSSKEKIGMRLFSKMICEKVRLKKKTTYLEVAEELINEIKRSVFEAETKNIRRRVYDSLNVLTAAKIIEKEGKEIVWKGFLYENQEIDLYKEERDKLEKRLEMKKKHLQEKIQKTICLVNLAKRNKNKRTVPAGSFAYTISEQDNEETTQIKPPFVLISTKKDTLVSCEMTEDRSQYNFKFNSSFYISEDSDVFLSLGLDKVDTLEELCSIIPSNVLKHVSVESVKEMPTDSTIDAFIKKENS